VEGGHWQVSTDGGAQPLWARSGRELFYVDPRGRIMTIPVQTAPNFTAGNASVAVERGSVNISNSLARNYDVSPDGRRFLVIRSAAPTDNKSNPTQLHVVLNWGEELKRVAPVKR
jgi:hypothetical protein